MAIGRRREAIEQLWQFAEDRYLHQTGRRTESGDFELAEDLPELLEQGQRARGSGLGRPASGWFTSTCRFFWNASGI